MQTANSFRECFAGVPAGADVLLPPTCGTPAGIDTVLAEDSERLAGSTVWSGLLLGDYTFTDVPHRDRLRYGTWHVPKQLAELSAAGGIDAYPLRASQVIDFIRRRGAGEVVVAQVAPPDDDGYASLGVSGSYVHAASRSARKLIVHVNPAMPRTPGPCRIRLDDAETVIIQDQPLLEYPAPATDEVSATIAAFIEPLIPNAATLQVGLGSVPEAVLDALQRSGRSDLTIWGMAIDAIVDLDEAGMLRDDGEPAVITHDVLGTSRIFDWLDRNPRARLVDYDVCVSVPVIAAIPRFVSINSAIEIDLEGNANAEVLGGRQISGLGGGPDFADGARRSSGGVSILALPATARGGRVSRIVPTLSDAPHSLSRATVQHVVTEHGAADLSLLSLDARAEALIGLAAPGFRDDLWTAHRKLRARADRQ